MEITGSTDREIRIRLDFVKPFKASNDVTFTLDPDGASTAVTWRMTGRRSGLMAAMNKVLNFDKMIGEDFTKGLRELKQQAESRASG